MRAITIWLTTCVMCMATQLLGAEEPGNKEPTKEAARYWPQWRGPMGTGAAPKANPPVEFNAEKNLKWKVDLPGGGHASPIVWGDRIYIMTAVKTDRQAASAAMEASAPPVVEGRVEDASIESQPGGERPRGPRDGRRGRRGGPGRGQEEKPTNLYQFDVLALNRANGKQVWRKTVCEEVPHEAGHPTASLASGSPVTDGERVYAFFGSRGLYCLDPSGKVLWDHKFGKMQTRNEFGEGSSPAVHDGVVVINWDHEGDDFIAAFDAMTGRQLWRNERDEPTSWSTPLIVETAGKAQVVVSASNFVRAYELKTGKEVWRCSGMTANAIPTPVADEKLLYAISGFRGAALLAIDYHKAKGDITGKKAIVWSHDSNTPYVPSPLLYERKLCFFDNTKAIFSCFDARSGKKDYGPERLGVSTDFYASPVGAGGRIYLAARDGSVVVLKAGGKFEVLATNKFEDEFDATPAVAGDELYLRGNRTLYCIAKK